MRTHDAALKFARSKVAVKDKTLEDLSAMVQGAVAPGKRWNKPMYEMLIALENKVSTEKWMIQDRIDFVLRGGYGRV